MLIVNTCDELIQLLKCSRVVIYGTGYVARRFYKSLHKYQIQNRIECFVTTKGTEERFQGLNVVSIDELIVEDGLLICVAVHEALYEEITEILNRMHCNNFVWVYPFLYELLLEKPIQEYCDIPIKKILEASPGDWLSIWYLAIDQYYGHNNYGYETYVLAWSLSSGLCTANRRLEKFKALIEKWEKQGYDENSLISVLEDFHLIDGSHRVALGVYHGVEQLKGRIYAYPSDYEMIHDKNILLPRSFLVDRNFGFSLIKKFDEVNKMIKENIGN